MNEFALNGAPLDGDASPPAARTADELLEQLMRFLPPSYCGASALLSAISGALREAEVAYGTLQGWAYFGGASGKWLTLHAHGVGVLRATGEGDDSLRLRLRSVDDLLTPAALESLVNDMIAPETCRIVEWFDEPYADYEGDGGAWADSCLASGGPSSFLVVIPEQGGQGFAFGDYADVDCWADSSFAGDGPEPSIYSVLVALVQRAKAAGTFWRLVLES